MRSWRQDVNDCDIRPQLDKLLLYELVPLSLTRVPIWILGAYLWSKYVGIDAILSEQRFAPGLSYHFLTFFFA